MPLITSQQPDTWQDLEVLVAEILAECGMDARRQITLELPRGEAVVDVYAEETTDGIRHRTICECKHWKTNVPRDVVHAFRTVMAEAGAHRGYVIASSGFQRGAVAAAESTNVELVTFEEFQERHFEKWVRKRLWSLEETISGFHSYYEPIGPAGYGLLETDEEVRAYDEVWDRYRFAGLMLMPFSPYLRMLGDRPLPPLPFDCTQLDESGIRVPDDIGSYLTYREFLKRLEEYALEGLPLLREVNPHTRGREPSDITRED